MEGRLELGAVVGLDLKDPEWELLEDAVHELDGGLLVESVVDLENSESGAVVDCRELLVLLSDALDGAR